MNNTTQYSLTVEVVSSGLICGPLIEDWLNYGYRNYKGDYCGWFKEQEPLAIDTLTDTSSNFVYYFKDESDMLLFKLKYPNISYVDK